jgi:excisionase family DNA binding protein
MMPFRKYNGHTFTNRLAFKGVLPTGRSARALPVVLLNFEWEGEMIALQKDLLTAREVALRLGIGVRTLWRWTASGQLPPPVRTGSSGRIVRWKAADIQRFVEQLPVSR